METHKITRYRRGSVEGKNREFFDVHTLPGAEPDAELSVLVFPVWDAESPIEVTKITDDATGEDVETLDCSVQYPGEGEEGQPITVAVSVGKGPVGDTIQCYYALAGE